MGALKGGAGGSLQTMVSIVKPWEASPSNKRDLEYCKKNCKSGDTDHFSLISMKLRSFSLFSWWARGVGTILGSGCTPLPGMQTGTPRPASSALDTKTVVKINHDIPVTSATKLKKPKVDMD